MFRNKPRGLAVLALAATTLLGACTDMYLDRRDTVSFGAGDAVAANKVTHMVDPWPVRSAIATSRMTASAWRRPQSATAPTG